MLGSSVIDTAIGLVFVFLLVSLLVTITNELIAAALRSRAKWLRIGLERLLGSAWMQQLYEHPLVYGTAGAGTGPSYIPSRSFTNVLLDLLRDGDATIAQARTALQATLDALAVPAAPPGAAPDAGAAAAATLEALKAGVREAARRIPDARAVGRRMAADLARLPEALPPTVGAAVVEVQKFIDAFPARYLRELIDDVQEPRIRKPLLALFDDAQGDVQKFKQNVEIWFNNAMDRVGGWYKRRAQWVTLGIGLLLAVSLNVDAVLIARHLQTDAGVREALVAQAVAYAKAPPPGRPAGSARQVACLTGLGAANAADCDATPQPADAARAASADGDQLAAQFRSVRAQLTALGLPIGWPGAQGVPAPGVALPLRAQLKALFDTALAALALHWIGWLVTALAATLGAPFWFDTLNRMMAIRSAGKAPEEAPKPPKEVPLPLEPGQSPKEADLAHG